VFQDIDGIKCWIRSGLAHVTSSEESPLFQGVDRFAGGLDAPKCGRRPGPINPPTPPSSPAALDWNGHHVVFAACLDPSSMQLGVDRKDDSSHLINATMWSPTVFINNNPSTVW
jgi:hypothetical protein